MEAAPNDTAALAAAADNAVKLELMAIDEAPPAAAPGSAPAAEAPTGAVVSPAPTSGASPAAGPLPTAAEADQAMATWSAALGGAKAVLGSAKLPQSTLRRARTVLDAVERGIGLLRQFLELDQRLEAECAEQAPALAALRPPILAAGAELLGACEAISSEEYGLRALADTVADAARGLDSAASHLADLAGDAAGTLVQECRAFLAAATAL